MMEQHALQGHVTGPGCARVAESLTVNLHGCQFLSTSCGEVKLL